MTRMRVAGLTRCPGRHDPLLVLETDSGDMRLGLVLPASEAGRLARVLGLARCRCAPVYGLIDQLVGQMPASVIGAVLDASPEGIRAALLLDRQGERVALPCHPVDAIAVALRSRGEIHATAGALAHGYPAAGPMAPGPDVARWLARIRPSDFSVGAEDEA